MKTEPDVIFREGSRREKLVASSALMTKTGRPGNGFPIGEFHAVWTEDGLLELLLDGEVVEVLALYNVTAASVLAKELTKVANWEPEEDEGDEFPDLGDSRGFQ